MFLIERLEWGCTLYSLALYEIHTSNQAHVWVIYIIINSLNLDVLADDRATELRGENGNVRYIDLLTLHYRARNMQRSFVLYVSDSISQLSWNFFFFLSQLSYELWWCFCIALYCINLRLNCEFYSRMDAGYGKMTSQPTGVYITASHIHCTIFARFPPYTCIVTRIAKQLISSIEIE